ncbi:hypothetical protein BHM03_00062348 [Ensete ventricosum]|nr:hypothetical protein BHM03_00062348 [Ensete ventricosum]
MYVHKPKDTDKHEHFIKHLICILTVTRRQVAEACAASPTPAPARSQSRSCDPVQSGPNFDSLSSDTANSLREQVCQVHKRLDEVQKEVLKSREEIGESSKGGSPFAPDIQGKPLPATFKLPTLEPYDGSSDPTEHIAAFRAQMSLYDTSDALMCRAFPTTLRGPARTWTETVEVLLVTDRATVRNATRDAATSASIQGRRDVGGGQVGRDEAPQGGAAPRTPHAAAEEKGGQAPNPMKSHSERRDKRRYYHFQREYGHDTKECRDLQYQIEHLIRRGHLRRYVRDQFSLSDSRPPRNSSPRPKGPVEKQIDVIFEGPASGNNISSAHKAYA